MRRSRRRRGSDSPSFSLHPHRGGGEGRVARDRGARRSGRPARARRPRCRGATRAASTARSEVIDAFVDECRASMPVRSRIHSSVVSTCLEPRVGTRRGGRTEPTPVMVACPGHGRRGYRNRADQAASAGPGSASGPGIAIAAGAGSTRFIIFVSTSPGPASRNVVAPAAARAADRRSPRTRGDHVLADSSRSRAGSVTSSPLTFSAIGMAGSRISMRPARRRPVARRAA